MVLSLQDIEKRVHPLNILIMSFREKRRISFATIEILYRQKDQPKAGLVNDGKEKTFWTEISSGCTLKNLVFRFFTIILFKK